MLCAVERSSRMVNPPPNPHLVKSMRMSAFPPWTSVKVSGVTSLQIFSASRKTRRTFSSSICQGNRTILPGSNTAVKGAVAQGGHQHRSPASHLLSAVISSAGRWAEALRLANKTPHHAFFFFSWVKTTLWHNGGEMLSYCISCL